MPPDYQQLHKEAQQHYDAASYLLHRTYLLAKDPKLLLGIIDRLAKSLEAAMDAVLEHDRQLQLIPASSKTFQDRYLLFQTRSAKRYHFPPEPMLLLQQLREILELHQKSPTEFRRRGQLVMANRDFQLRRLTPVEVSGYLQQTGLFLKSVSKITTEEQKE